MTNSAEISSAGLHQTYINPQINNSIINIYEHIHTWGSISRQGPESIHPIQGMDDND